jgi:Gpi18-like mannosyltransferase
LERGWVAQGWLCYSLAFATKLQSVAFAPLLIAGTVAGIVAGTFAGSMARGRRKSFQSLFAGILAGASSFALIALPWILTGRFDSLLRIYTTSPEARVDVSAFNLWYLVFSGQTGSISSLYHPLGLFLSYQGVGLVLFGLFALIVAGLVVLRRMSLFLAAAALGIGMFALMTEMHERHLFPALAFLLLAAFAERGDSYLLFTAKAAEGKVRDLPAKPLLSAYCVLSFSYLANLVTIAPPGFLLFVSLLAPNPTADTWQLLLLKDTSFALALLNLGVLVWLVLSGARNRVHRARQLGDPTYI